MAFRWRADDGPTLNASFVIYRESGPVLLRKPIFVVYQGGLDPLYPPLDLRMILHYLFVEKSVMILSVLNPLNKEPLISYIRRKFE